MEQILQKKKKTFPIWNIIKKFKMVYNFEILMRNNII